MRAAVLLALVTSLHAAHLVYQKPIPAGPMAVDTSGNVYVYNNSGITKLDPDGNVLYAKALPLPATAIAADTSGNVFLAGVTNSDTLPTTPGVLQPMRNPGVCIAGDRGGTKYPCQDAFVAKVDANGNLAWASYLGGINNDQANGVAADAAGNVYVTGFTLSADFPIVKAFQPAFGGYADAFLTKISADGTKILFSSFFGGENYDVAHQVALDAAGNAYVAGINASRGFLAFLLKVDPNGGLVYEKDLGPAGGYSEGTSVAVDRQGAVYLGGMTNSPSYSTTPGAWSSVGGSPYQDFLVKFGSDGSGPVYAAQFQGSSFGPTRIAIDGNGAAYLAGGVDSTTFPIAGPAMQPCPGSDGFLVELNPAGSAPLYSSFEAAGWMSLAPDGSLYLLGGQSLRKFTALASPGDPYLSPGCVLNGASFASHTAYGQPGISPGEVVTLKGTGLGPAVPGLDGVQVLFDGIPGWLLYAQDGQINVVAPYEIAGQAQTNIQVQYQGRTAPTVAVPVSVTSAAFFAIPQAVLTRGSSLSLLLTGAGQTDPPSVDGQTWTTTGGLVARVSAQLTTYGSTAGTVTATVPVSYAGPVPGLISGVQKITVQIPSDLPDSFVTPQFSAGSQLSFQIGGQTLNVDVTVK